MSKIIFCAEARTDSKESQSEARKIAMNHMMMLPEHLHGNHEFSQVVIIMPLGKIDEKLLKERKKSSKRRFIALENRKKFLHRLQRRISCDVTDLQFLFQRSHGCSKCIRIVNLVSRFANL